MPKINEKPTETTVYPDRKISFETFIRWLEMRRRLKQKNHHITINFNKKERLYLNHENL